MFEPAKKRSIIFGMVLHFCCLTAIMIVCGIHFGWIDFENFGIIMMIGSVAAVYAFTVFVYYILDKHWADQINSRLSEKYQDEEI